METEYKQYSICLERLDKLLKGLIDHTNGELTLVVTPTKDGSVRVIIKCGKVYIYHIKKTRRPGIEF